MEKYIDKIYDRRAEQFFGIVCIFAPVIRSFISYVTKLIGLYKYFDFVTYIVAVIIILSYANVLSCVFKTKDFIAYLIVIILYGFSYFLHPDNRPWFELDFVIRILPYFFVGLLINRIDISVEKLFKLARIAIAIMFVVLLRYHSLVGDVDEQMSRAYLVLPILMMITYAVIEYKHKIDFVFLLLGVAILLLCAVRGAILLYIVFLGFIVISYKNKILLGFLSILAILLGSKSISLPILYGMKNFFESKGYDSRVFRYYLANDIRNDTGRRSIFQAVADMISKHPFGSGLYSDRRASLNVEWVYRKSKGVGGYAHNIFLEFICQYGWIVGTILLLILLWLIFTGYKNISNEKRIIFIIVTLCYFGKLFFSSSYLEEKGFFVLLGLCISIAFANSRIKVVLRRSEL